MLAIVVLDWFSRRAFSWCVSITMEAAFCVETLEDALARHGNTLPPSPCRTRGGKTWLGSISGMIRRSRRQWPCGSKKMRGGEP
jgi:putative transposase